MSKNQLISSQLITTFGPGAMVDLPDSSVIIAGLDHWYYDLTNVPIIEEARLVDKARRLLNSPNLTLRPPPAASDSPSGFKPTVTAWSFPEWFIVQKTDITTAGHRRRRLVHANSLDKGKYRDVGNAKLEVVPVRFVRACENGHVGDIDWRSFVHSSGQNACLRDLWLEERGTTGDLDEVWVVCECGADRAMSAAARRELKSLGSCNGSRPWLGAGTRESCGRPNRLLIRSASNAYFPQLLSVISIPDPRTAIDELISSAWNEGLSIVDGPDKLALVRLIPNLAVKLQGLSDASIMAAIDRYRNGTGGAERAVKEVEFEALAEAKTELGSDKPDGDFFARALPSSEWTAPWMTSFERIVMAHRLREVVAQVGFTRFEAAGPDIQGELSLDVRRAALGIDSAWLPAVENRGEGIFLLFKPETIQTWMARAEVKARGSELLLGFDGWKKSHEGSSRQFPGVAYYMLHSFSHLLLTAISLECGYPASSLRERIYASNGNYGILIYTGTSDAEGTLGGLILAGREIQRHVRRALELGTLCSNDPVCAYHEPGQLDEQPLLGSACHGCLLIAETSCEQHNAFLDRSLVVPTVENRGCEFFSGVV